MRNIGHLKEELEARVIKDKFLSMPLAERRVYFEINGFLIVPGAIDEEVLVKLNREFDRTTLDRDIELGPKETRTILEKSSHSWVTPSVAKLIENPKVLQMIRLCYGDDIRFFKGVYYPKPRKEIAEKPRQMLHMDYGGAEYEDDFRNTSASWVNVGFYLCDLTFENGPLWVVPRSHRQCHLIPGSNFEYLEEKAKIVLAKAGTAVLFHCSTVHAGGLNFTDQIRRALFYSYRPGWAKPVGLIPEWPQRLVENAPPKRKPLLVGLNEGLPHST